MMCRNCKAKQRLLHLSIFVWSLCAFTSGKETKEHPFGLHSNHPYGILSLNYETPHIKWANPYSKGAPKALVLAPMWTHRETVELAQRLSLDFTPWMCSTYFEIAPNHLCHEARFFFPPAGMLYEHLHAYLAPDQEFDVIVVGKLDWDMFPPESRFALLKKVAEGTGLVFINPPRIGEELDVVFNRHPADGDTAILEGVPLSALPRFKNLSGKDLVRTSTFGTGRVVRITYDEPAMVSKEGYPYDSGYGSPHRLDFLHSLTPRWVDPDYQSRWTTDYNPQFEIFYYDYYQSLLARAVLWATRMEPDVRFSEIKADKSYDRKNLHAASIRLILDRGKSTARRVRARVAFRNTHGEILAENALTLSFGNTGTATADLSLPLTPAGTIFTDIWIMEMQGEKIINWGSLSFDVNADIVILELAQDEHTIERGDAIQGRLNLSRPLRVGEELMVSLWDSLGRKITRWVNQPTKDTTCTFSMGKANPLVILHELRAEVWKADRVVAESRHVFPIRKGNDPYDFKSILWSTPKNDMINHAMLKKLRAEDEADAIDVSWRGHLLDNSLPRDMDSANTFTQSAEMENKVLNLSRADLQIMGYNYRFGVLGGDENHRIKGPCFTDPEWLAEIDDAFSRDAQVYGPHGPIGWTHGDESFLSEDPNVCWSPSCLAGFRKYLRNEYHDLASLNTSWESTWKTWDEILPGTFDEARKSGRYPPWLDHKRFMNTAFSGLYDRACEALTTGDESARSGFDGPKGFWLPNGGIDWWQLCKTRGVLQAYNESGELEVFRSFAHPESLRGAWYGSYGDNFSRPTGVKASHYIIWNSLFNHANSSWFWTMGAPGPLSGYAPDLTSLPYFSSRTEALREIKAGIGKMILSSHRENDGIAIHFSDASRIADSLMSEKKADWSTAFASNLRYYRHLLEANGLSYDFVSYEQVEQGKLIQDKFRVLILPYSRAISKRESEQITRFVDAGGTVIADLTPGILDEHGRIQHPPLLSSLFPPAPAKVDSSILPGQVNVNAFGKGKALLIGERSRNCSISVYGFSKNFQDRLGPHIEAFKDILASHTTIRPHIEVTPRRSEIQLPPTVIRRFSGGENEIVTLLRYFFAENHESYPCQVRFERSAHLYDVRLRKYLGFVDTINADISHTAHIYAMLPYRVKGLGVTTRRLEYSAGDLVEVKLSVVTDDPDSPASHHCIRLQVMAPDGSEMKEYGKNIMAQKGQCAAALRFALNDPPGEYRLVARDILSGIEGSKPIKLHTDSTP